MGLNLKSYQKVMESACDIMGRKGGFRRAQRRSSNGRGLADRAAVLILSELKPQESLAMNSAESRRPGFQLSCCTVFRSQTNCKGLCVGEL